MKFCQHCGKEIMDQAVICPHCGCAASPMKRNPVSGEDEVSAGLCVLSFLIPLFGLIFWGMKYKETPKKAKACGIIALISFILGIITYIPLFIRLIDLFV